MRVSASPERRVHVALAAAFAAAAAVIVWAGRGLTFQSDDWTFIRTRLDSGVDVYLDPHNEHLSAVPVAVYKLLFATAGLDHHGAYRIVLLAAFLACAALVFAYGRPRVGPVAALLAAVLIVFLGQAWEVLFVTIGIGYLVSLAAGIGMLLMLDRRTRLGDACAAGLLAVAIASSSLGLPFALGALVELVSDSDRRRRLLVVAVPLALYAAWFLAYRNAPTRGIDLADAPEFLAQVAASAMGGLTGVAVVSDHLDGTLHWLVTAEHLIALAAVALLVRTLARDGIRPRAAMLITTLAAFWLLLAVLRAGGNDGFGGTVSPYSSRYVYPGAVLIVLIALELARGREPQGRVLTALAAAVGAVCVANVVWLVVSANELRRQADLTRADLAAIEIMSDEVRPSFVPSGDPRDGNVQAASYLSAVRRIGSSPAWTAAELAGAPERARLTGDRTLVRIQEISWLGPIPAAPGRGCRVVRAEGGSAVEDLELPAGGVFLPRAPRQPVEIRLRRFASGYGTAPSGGTEQAVAIRPSLGSAPGPPWHARLSSGAAFTICDAP